MHPGNIIVRELRRKSSGKSLFKSRPHVIFLDVGMTAELPKKDRDNLLEFFKAVALRDGRTAAECTLRLSNKQRCPYPEAFIKVCCSPTASFVMVKTNQLYCVWDRPWSFLICHFLEFRHFYGKLITHPWKRVLVAWESLSLKGGSITFVGYTWHILGKYVLIQLQSLATHWLSNFILHFYLKCRTERKHNCFITKIFLCIFQ